MPNLDDVAGVLRAAGVTVHETPGWITRGYAGQDLAGINGVLWHHTATGRGAYTTSAAPTLGLCINGRSDLAGPLCNMVFDRNGEIWLVATGVANHAGAGSAPGIPKDMGNHYLIGIEMESSGVKPWDWTAKQLKMAPVVGAALERHYLQKLAPELRLQLGHMEYSSQGKIDPAGWPGGMDGLRASINAILAGGIKPAGGTTTTVKDDDMPSVKELFDEPIPRQGGVPGVTSLKGMVGYMDANLGRIINAQAAQDAQIKGLVGAVKALAAGEQFDEAKLLAGVQAAAAAGVKSAVESIDTTVTLKG
jgi:hypothetical protein